MHPRRSALYVPGSNPRAIEKARTLAADVLIFDLEDSVAPEAKEASRANIFEALRIDGYAPRERVIRINAPSTTWFDSDLSLVQEIVPNAVLIPKVETLEVVLSVATVLSKVQSLAIWCMLETPSGILAAEQIAAHERVSVLVMGTTDLVTDLHAREVPDRAPLTTSMSLCILAARAHGCGVLDGVHMNITDEDGFKAACHQGRDFGFDGKTLIHPRTIATANAVFAPNEAELVEARRVIEAEASARARGKGIVVLEGRLIEALHVSAAEQTIAMADTIAKREKALGC